MKTNQITLGGIFAALLLLLLMISMLGIKWMQIMAELIQVLVVVEYIDLFGTEHTSVLSFVMSSLLLCFVIYPYQALVYSVPTISEGILLGYILRKHSGRFIEWVTFIFANLLAFIYKAFLLFHISDINITEIYARFIERIYAKFGMAHSVSFLFHLLLVGAFVVDLLVTNTILFIILKTLLNKTSNIRRLT